MRHGKSLLSFHKQFQNNKRAEQVADYSQRLQQTITKSGIRAAANTAEGLSSACSLKGTIHMAI